MRPDRPIRKAPRALAILVLAPALLLAPAALDRAASRLQAGGPTKPARFRKTTFATGLNFPYGMQRLSDGSLLVGTSDPTPGGGLFSSTGTLVRLADANGDGRADGPATVLYSGLPGVLTSVRRADSLVFVTSSQAGSERISFLRTGATPAAPYTLLGSINFSFPSGWEHTTYGLAVRGSAGSYDLFFNVGSQFNSVPTTGTVGLTGLISGIAQGDSIYRVSVRDTGGFPVVSDLTQIAKGLRNAAGLAFHPSSGDLYFADNGIDGLVNPDEPLSADELNRISAADIGGTVEDFGFPSNYVEYRTGRVVGGAGIAPLVVFQPIPNPSTGSESEGPAQIAFAPDAAGIYLGFHGRFSLGGVANEENPLVYYAFRKGTYTDFVSNDDPNVGHLDGLLSTSDSLFAADLSSTGDLVSPGTGVIYQFRFR